MMYLRFGCHLQTECSVEFENLGPKERLSSSVYLASLVLVPSDCDCQSSISRAGGLNESAVLNVYVNTLFI